MTQVRDSKHASAANNPPLRIGVVGRRLLSLLLAVAVLLGSPTALSGCSGGGELVGSLFSGITDQINGVVTNAGAQAQATVLAASGALQAAVSQSESAFATELNTGINNAGDAARNDIEHLHVLLADLQSGNAQLVQQALSGAQTLINTIPFSNKNPQVSAYSPHFTVAGSQVEVLVRGNFFYAFEKKLTPTLEAGGTTYQPNLNTTQELGFAVPAAVFVSPSGAFGPISVALTVPYEKGVIFKSIKPGVFRLLITTLPTNPVTSAVLTNTVPVNGTAYRNLTTPTGGQYALASYDCHDHAEVQTVLADPGWQIIPSSVQVNYSVLRNPVRTQLEITRSTTGLVIHFSTQSNCFLGISSGSGDMAFNVSYTEEQPTHSTKQTTTPLTIHWGNTLSQPVTRNQWRLDATLFNGNVLQATETNHSNKYLIVDNNGENVTETAPEPSQLVEGAVARRADTALSRVGGSTSLSVRPDASGKVLPIGR